MDMKKKDDLLPLFSHAQFGEDLDAFVLNSERQPYSLLFVDLDFFNSLLKNSGLR